MPAQGGLIGQGDPSSRRLAGAAPAVLAIHGFGGTPLEVDLVVEAAQAAGLAARAPLLAGHGRHVRELAATCFDDWLGSARQEFLELRAEHGRLIVVGLSLGSLLATELCLEYAQDVAGLGLLANAFWLTAPFPAFALWAYHHFGLPDVFLPKAGADIRDPQAQATHLTLSAQPARAAAGVWFAGRRLRDRLSEIRTPAYLAHGRLDRVCPARNLTRVAARLSSPRIRQRLCPRAGHIVTRDYGADLVRDDLTRFFENVRATAAAPQRQAPVDP